MVCKKVRNILAEILNLDMEDINQNLELTSENEIEKIHIAKLIIECEKIFKITIHDEDVNNFHTLKDIVKYIKEMIEEHEGNISESSEEERVGWHYF